MRDEDRRSLGARRGAELPGLRLDVRERVRPDAYLLSGLRYDCVINAGLSIQAADEFNGAALLGEQIGAGFVAGSLTIGVGVRVVSRERVDEPEGNSPKPGDGSELRE